MMVNHLSLIKQACRHCKRCYYSRHFRCVLATGAHIAPTVCCNLIENFMRATAETATVLNAC
jgi:hypothetical protein